MGTNYEQKLSKALDEMTETIDTFERNGSEWIDDKFLPLDLNIVTYQFCGIPCNNFSIKTFVPRLSIVEYCW